MFIYIYLCIKLNNEQCLPGLKRFFPGLIAFSNLFEIFDLDSLVFSSIIKILLIIY